MVDFIAEKEVDTWGNGLHEDTLREYALNLIRFLEIAVQDARRESPYFQPISLAILIMARPEFSTIISHPTA